MLITVKFDSKIAVQWYYRVGIAIQPPILTMGQQALGAGCLLSICNGLIDEKLTKA
jgi:hypothetical protein